MHTQRFVRLFVILDRHLRLGIGTQVGHRLAFTADDGQLLEDDVREDQRRRHHLAGFVAGIAEHDALVAGALVFLGGTHDALVDVGRLLVDGRQDTARIAVELVLALRISDAVDDAARHALHVDIGIRTHFTRHDHQPGGTERFAGYLRIGIAAQEFVEDGVGNLV